MVLTQLRQDALNYGGKANQHHQQLKQSRESSIRPKSVDGPEANCSEHDDTQSANQGRNHVRRFSFLV
jgi:hypothetical protein